MSQAAHETAKLTAKQLDCLRGVWLGRQINEIGVDLGISGRTVETHLKLARQTLGAPSSLAAARSAAASFGWARDQPGEGQTRITDPGPGAATSPSSGASAAAEAEGSPVKGGLPVIAGMMKQAAQIVLYAGVLFAGLLLLLDALQQTVGRPLSHR